VANEIEVASVTRDALTGNQVGRVLVADVYSATRETLTGDRYGLVVGSDVRSATRETLTGYRTGRNVAADVFLVVREVLIKEPPIRVMSAVREVLASLPNDPLTQQRRITGYRQSVVMVRPVMALPSTVKSAQIVPSLRQQVVRHAERTWARSGIFASTLRMQSLVRRNVLPAYDMNSFATVGVYRQQVVQSRGRTYVPVSMVYTATQRQLVVSHRVVTLAPNVRTAITVGGQRQQIVQSRKTVVVVIMTEAHAASLAQQVVVDATRPAPHSEIRVGNLAHLTVQRHTVIPPGIDDRVAQVREQVVIERAPAPPFGVVHAATASEQIVIERQAVMHQSPLIAGGERMLAVQHRDTYAPQYALGRHTSTLQQQVIAERVPVPPYSGEQVASMRLAFVLHRVTTRPIDVIDPGIGRHAASLAQLSVQRVVTIPPETISKQTRWVYNVAAQVAVGDAFPAPDYPPPEPSVTDVYQFGEQVVHGDLGVWEPVSAVTVRSVGAMLALGDNTGWLDATLPHSDVTSFSVQQAIAMGDVFPDMSMVQSDAEVAAMMSVVALGDSTMPDPMLPLSEIQTATVAEIAVLGDADLPDPMIPLSDVTVRRLAAFTALRDGDMIGRFDMSEIRMPSLVEFLIIPDKGLVGIPLRTGPRPVISVSMS
jgi:hypothetical protein